MIPDIGAVLKTQRSSREWSLTQAAEKTGVSKAMLGQIERGESSPTVATLWKIATGFNVPFSLFLSDSAAPATAQVQRSSAAPPWQQNATMQVTPLFPFDAELGFDMLEIELAAGGRSDSSAHDSGVIEHVLVISGSLLLTVREEQHRLQSGEGLRFQADCPHSYRNDTAKPVRFQSLIHYPKSR
ncbi:XRE family transcriptional regulator [Erwinia pyri]|uniref:XRE family transcriptional regulator n=1 Tax=Erwinia pyri TaxID=3062598 RepID=A0AA50HRY1_9GAMM|nr:XRE family transcriptional regulator [Erwinia sp. DE2]WLS80480.1 XRE family transcriptional regulator [Erwinia sp. DE2]